MNEISKSANDILLNLKAIKKDAKHCADNNNMVTMDE